MTNKKKILVIVAVLSAIIVSFMGGQSFSKYVSRVKGQAQMEVARWSFLVNGEEESIQNMQLGSTCDDETLLDNKIAPGTQGKFNIEIDATGSEVGIQYHVAFEEKSQKPRNLIFIYDKATYANLQDLEVALEGVIDANDETKKISIPIQWKWEYETGNDEGLRETEDREDTEDGKMLQNYNFDIIVTGTQLPPSV